jgi:spore coat polysaccharide biosynthesis protein SpsF
MRADSETSRVLEEGFEFSQSAAADSGPAAEGRWLERLVAAHNAAALLLDIRSELDSESIRAVQATGVLVGTLDDPSDRRLIVDLAFYPPVPQALALDWSGACGEHHIGWQWVILHPDFSPVHRRTRRADLPGQNPIVIVTMGGSDPAGLTLKVLFALEEMPEEFDTVVVLGQGFTHDADIASFLRGARRGYDVRRDVRKMSELMGQADVAVASFGGTAYELAVMGVPAVLLSLSDDHAASAQAFDRAGIGMSLGVHSAVRSFEIAAAVSSLLADTGRRDAMRNRARRLLDGRGTMRVAEVINQRATPSQ